MATYIYSIFITVFLFKGTAVYSQDVIEKVAADACKCIEALEADIVIIKSMSEIGSRCLYPSMKKNEQELTKVYNFDFSNEELAGKILDKVGNEYSGESIPPFRRKVYHLDLHV